MDQQLVKYEGTEATRPQVADKLRAMGYPERGTLHGLSAGVANAKSFVSCAIGRIS
jgi:copper chaperone